MTAELKGLPREPMDSQGVTMESVYTGPRSTVEAVLEHGFEEVESDPVRLRPVTDGYDWLSAEAALLLAPPDGQAAELAASNGHGFVVPPAELDKWRVTARVGVGVPEARSTRRKRWPFIALLAGVLALIAALAVFAGEKDVSRTAAPSPDPPADSPSGATRPSALSPAPPRRSTQPPSRAVGSPTAGALVNGVRLPRGGEDFFTWDSTRLTSPNPSFRRFGTDRTVRTVLSVAASFARAHPSAPRLGVADLSLPRGGKFGVEYGGSGHLSHQNGLDVDVLYPLRSGREAEGKVPEEVDRRLAQDVVDRFVAAGAVTIYVGPNTGLTGPDGTVVLRSDHDTHMHIRLPRR